MLLYTSIFVVSLIAVFYSHFFYTAIRNKNTSVRTSNARIATIDSSERFQKERLGFNINNGLPTRSVQKDESVSSDLDKKHPAKPEVCHDEDTAKLIREKRLLSMYESYKARCEANTEPLTLEMVSKPFKRKVAP